MVLVAEEAKRKTATTVAVFLAYFTINYWLLIYP